MPKLPPVFELVDPLRKKRSTGSNDVCIESGEFGNELILDSSNSLFAGDDMIESEVMRLDITSGEAGWRWAWFVSGTRRFEDEGGRDVRLDSWRLRSGMRGGVDRGAILERYVGMHRLLSQVVCSTIQSCKF